MYRLPELHQMKEAIIMSLCQGCWNELDERCKECVHLRVLSPKMDPNENYYSCTKSLLKDDPGGCSNFYSIFGTVNEYIIN